jgi:hypothetical protein
MDHGVFKYGYWAARGYVLACGVFVLLATIASQAFTKELYYDQGPVPPLQDRTIDVAVGLVYALLLMLPYRWSSRGWLFKVRLALLVLSSLWLCSRVAVGVYDLIQGRRHWLILPASAFVLALAILAPVTFIAQRRR